MLKIILKKIIHIFIIHVEQKIIHETCIYSEMCLSLTLNKPKFCINRTLNKVLMQKIFVNLTCINQTPVYFEHKSWSFGGSV